MLLQVAAAAERLCGAAGGTKVLLQTCVHGHLRLQMTPETQVSSSIQRKNREHEV